MPVVLQSAVMLAILVVLAILIVLYVIRGGRIKKLRQQLNNTRQDH
jgi:hypothetical protein